VEELIKHKVLERSRTLFKSKMIDEEQWNKIKIDFASALYTPSIFIRVLFFIFSFIGLSTLAGPMFLIFDPLGDLSMQVILLVLGVAFILFTEFILIKQRAHYRSGITEAGLFTGIFFIAFGILAFEDHSMIVYPIVGFLLSLFASIRYLNQVALVSAFFFLGWIIFQILIDLGGIFEAIIPFVFMAVSALTYTIGALRQLRTDTLFSSQFIIIKTITLLVFYLAGNYYVVRELSIELMNLHLEEGEDIPFAILFYVLTALIPIIYLYWGIHKKSILHIRVGLLTIALSAVTFKYYFSLGHPMVTVTLAGALLIGIAVALFQYLKRKQGAFTADKLIQDKWSSSDLMALIASQTLGGNKPSGTDGNEEMFGGGSFGGGGAGSQW